MRRPSTVGPSVVDDHDESYRSVTVQHHPWSPAQLVSLAAGLLFIIFGGVALARTGVDFSHLSSTHVTVAGAGQTELMALLELAFGILLVAAGSVPGASRGLMSFLGMVAFAFGVIVAAQPSTFTPRLGIGKGYGIFLIVVGAVLVLAAWLSPVLWGTSHRAGVEHRDVMESR